ncbi:MAG: sensor domain-containing diguanylate cyclase [Candidatus Thiodiazotropha sp. 6PLUC4]
MALYSNLKLVLRDRFLRRILVLSTIVILILPAAGHFFVYPLFELALIKNTEREAVRAGRFLAVHMNLIETRLTKQNLPKDLEKHGKDAITYLGLVKLKLFSADGTTLFSTEPRDIGIRNEHDYFHNQVSRGQPYTKMVEKNQLSAEGQIYQADVVETYVPIVSQKGEFDGAFETYYDVTPRITYIDKLTNYLTLSSITGGIILLGILIMLLFRASSASQQRRRTEEKLRELNRQNEMILTTAGEGIFGVDLHGNMLFANPAAISMMGWPKETLLDSNHHTLVHHTKANGEPNPPEECPVRKAFTELKTIHSEKEIFWREDNSSFPVEMTAAPQLDDGEASGAVVIFRDITSRLASDRALQEANKKLQELARIDGLTGIANRRSFDELLENSWYDHTRSGEELSLIMVDIDYFKYYNDSYGHQAGDECIKQVTRALSESLFRRNDRLARYGGEEFVLVLTNTNSHGAMLVAERLRKAVETLQIKHEHSNVSDWVTISIGVATIMPSYEMKSQSLLRQADEALYQAKAEGRNRCIASEFVTAD